MMSDYEERETKISKIEKRIASSALLESRLGPNQVIRLNVGGKIYCTFLSTLKNEKDSFFCAYFNDYFDPKPEEHDQAFFIDRPYEHFHLILNHLRGMDISKNLSEMKESELCNFMEEVVYYQISSIFNLFPSHGKAMLMNKFNIHVPDMLFHPNYISSNAELSPDHRRIQKISGGYEWNCACMGKTECTEFSVKLVANCSHVSIGFCTTRLVKLNSDNTSLSFSLCTHDGKLYCSRKCLRYGHKYIYQSIHDGSVIKVIYEPKRGRISFLVNDINRGMAFDRVGSNLTLYPIIELGTPDAQVECL
ncbi:hypothetical protein C9374_006771 [Naegleria lovaniensis]|uniref:BTB domain-containing protein n=1 Tax=Naegleria lovaniensis TaxID=51637 RepID=A0AA88GLD5_NAELO|nr:uncharacterized protein C9374_006771 [Naegleria lovaniensis]KAG2379654.1 hypothetical protein C9374_006771 [Naegleria lovaniensis]